MIYLDNNATTPLKVSVQKIMNESLAVFGNPSSVHGVGREARMLVDMARRQVASLFNVRSEQVVFTSGGTESDVMAVSGAMNTRSGKLVISSTEHAAVHNTAMAWQEKGREVTIVSVDQNGLMNLAELEETLQKGETSLVSVMHGNNETGVLQPVEKIAELCKRYQVLFHTDAVQTAGKLKLDFPQMGCDMLSVSFHKFGGPKGIGALILRNELDLEALISGGGQERKRRGGTENVLAIAGAGAAAQSALEDTPQTEYVQALRDSFEEQLTALGEPITILGQNASRTPNTSCFFHEEIEGETTVLAMDMAGIHISQGSACSSGRIEASRVVLNMGYSEKQAKNTVRVAFAWHNTQEDVEALVKAYKEFIKKAKR